MNFKYLATWLIAFIATTVGGKRFMYEKMSSVFLPKGQPTRAVRTLLLDNTNF